MKMNIVFALSLGIGIAGSFLVPQEARADVILNEKTTFYSVKGSTGREIFKSMIDNGPKVGGPNGHALATTEYKYDVRNIDVEIRGGRCIPIDLDVHVDVKYTYPKWLGSSAARATTRAAWRDFYKSVTWHEQQHVKIALDYARDYRKALMRTRLLAKENCTKASFISAWRTTSAALKHNRRQKSFDRRDLRPGGRGYEAQMKLLQAQ